MRDFFDWYKENFRSPDPWLILGKGPSFSKVKDFNIADYRTLALNDVVARLSVTVSHAIDIDVVERCREKLLRNASVLVMPWVPHCRTEIGRFSKKAFFGVGAYTLEEYCAMMPVLRQLNEEGRLLWYNLYTAGPRRYRPGSPVVSATEFSASAALNLLAMAGVRKARTLGVDGGRSYSTAFSNLEKKTMLQTGQSSYDSQFKGFAETIMSTGMDVAPLDTESPIKVFVGTQPEQMLAFKVLEYSIRRHCSMSVDVVPLFEAVEDAKIDIPMPKDSRLRPRTPFSFQRFAIPQLKGYSGRAIYVDSDMQVFKDIKALWMWPFGENDLLTVQEPAGSWRRPQFSVMVLDCERLRWDVGELVQRLDAGRWTYEQFMYEMAPAKRVAAALPTIWNDLERHNSRTALTHYTDMNSQPWLASENLVAELWCEELFSAIRDGFIGMDFLQEQIERGWVRPSLKYQLERRIADPLMLPSRITQHDLSEFVPPHRVDRREQSAPVFGSARSALQRLNRRTYARVRNFARILKSSVKKAKKTVRSRNDRT